MILKPMGLTGILVQFTQEISETVGSQVTAMNQAILSARLPGVVETIPAYAALTVRYDPFVTTYDTLCGSIRELADTAVTGQQKQGRVVRIPVCYGSAYGEDLPIVAEHAGMSEAEVVQLHASRAYRIFMLGFLPGFPYLGGMDERLVTPRKQTPRTKIPAGSVGIGGQQTGIYPMESPGGWQLIGRTPIIIFAPGRPLPYQAGDSIQFVPITPEAFERIHAAEKEGKPWRL